MCQFGSINELNVPPMDVLDVHRNPSLGVLIEWKDLPTWKCTWETFDAIRDHFPSLYFEDKVNLLKGEY